MIIGTSHFVSIQAAVNYYKDHLPGYSKKEQFDYVMELTGNKSISIGKPELKEGERLLIIKEEGRYAIEFIPPEERAVTSASDAVTSCADVLTTASVPINENIKMKMKHYFLKLAELNGEDEYEHRFVLELSESVDAVDYADFVVRTFYCDEPEKIENLGDDGYLVSSYTKRLKVERLEKISQETYNVLKNYILKI